MTEEHNRSIEYPYAGDIPDEPHWSENFATVGHDAQENFSYFYSIGRWYANPKLWREVLVLVLPDGEILVGKNYGSKTGGAVVSAAFSQYEISVPGRRVNLHYDGPVRKYSREELFADSAVDRLTGNCRLDVQFASNSPVWNMHEEHAAREFVDVAGAVHLEQLGYADCTVEYAGESHTFNCLSNRDRSLGPRDTSSYGAHCWIQGEFADRRRFYLYAGKSSQQAPDEPAGMSHAAVEENGQLYSAKLLDIEFVSGTDDAFKPYHIALEYGGGRMDIEVSEPRTIFPLSLSVPNDIQLGINSRDDCAFLFECTANMRCDGDNGIGWSERGYLGRRRQE